MSDSEGEPDGIYGDKVNVVARHVVRYILSFAESQSTVISRSKLGGVIREACGKENTKNVKFDKVFTEVNSLLFDTYGYHLVGLHPKLNRETITKKQSQSRTQTQTQSLSQANTQTQSQSQAIRQNQSTYDDQEPLNNIEHGEYPDLMNKAQNFILIDGLPAPPAKFEQYLLDQSKKAYEDRIIDEQYVGNDISTLSKSEFQDGLSTDKGLAVQGLTFIILAVVLFSKNNLLHQELTHHLQKFGVPQDGHKIPIIDMTVEELIKLLDKQEYITKIEERSKDGTQETVFYKIGRRTQAEFDRAALLSMCQELLGLDHKQTQLIGKSIDLSINDAYKVS